MSETIVWDVEFLTAPGAPQRFWCGPRDPDPVLVQIGAVRLGLTGDCALGESFECLVIPRDRSGARYEISEFFTRLTGITAARIAKEGLELADALTRFDAYTGGAPIWAWGTDELNAIAVSCYLAELRPPIPAGRFGNATRLFVAAGIPVEEVHGLRSNTLAGYFGIDQPDARAHDALSDARSTALALRHLLREGRLGAGDFALSA
ncbi:MAG: exonuclease [Rhodobacteraceae bacterium]|nr:exonuclease [Paracoccaceae bacterium]